MTPGAPWDVVVVGAGLAGSAAAAVAAEQGDRVLLVDGADDPSAGGNSVLAGGGVHIVRAEMRDDPDVLRARVRARALGTVDDELVDALAENAGAAFDWFVAAGARFEPDPPGDIACMLAPIADLTDMHRWRGRGSHLALRALQDRVRERGGTVRPATEIAELDGAADGTVRGLVTTAGERIPARNVVLADGGFQGDPELRRRHIGPAADRLFLRAAPSGRGVGLRIAEAAGAELVNMEWFYGHCMHGDVFENDRLWPWPALDDVFADGAIVVDRSSGRRVADEGLGGVLVANVVARMPDPLGTWMVIDEERWNASAGREIWGHMPANPELERRGATIVRAGDARALASSIGAPPDALADELGTYVDALGRGTTGELPVPRTAPGGRAGGGWVAFPLAPGITHTMGGPRTDRHGRVRGTSGDPIPGLFAAGAGAASASGGYFGGLASALTFGWLAGHGASRAAQGRRTGAGRA